MAGGARDQRQTMSPSAIRLVDVDEAVRILHEACQRRISADALAPLVQSAQYLASNCTPALLSSVLEACDATMAVEAAPKKLTMLNAAWKLLLTIATQEGVEPAYYRASVAHMVEQLRWGVLTHDWSDAKRARLASFFASHVVSTVRAHPQLLLLRTLDARAVIGQLVRLYFATCVTVATSTRDTGAVSLLYDNIVVRLHAVFDCLGNAAAASKASVYRSKPEAEAACSAEEVDRESTASSSPRDEAASGPSAALPPQQRCECPSSVVEELLSHCLSTAVAREVEEAADGGVTVRMALATAAFSLYLHVVRGALEATSQSAAGTGALSAKQEGDSSQRDAEEDEGAATETTAAQTSSWPRLTPLATQELVMKSLMWWMHRTTEEGHMHTSANRTSLLQVEVLTWAAALPPDVFCSEVSYASPAANPVSLRALWRDTLVTVWQQWLFSVCYTPQQSHELSGAGPAGSLRVSESHGTEATVPAAKLDIPRSQDGKTEPFVPAAKSMRFAALLLSSVAGTLHSSSAALMVLEAWVELFRRAEELVANIASTVRSPSVLATVDNGVTIVHLLLRVLADLRCGASVLVRGLLRLQRHHSHDSRYKASSEQSVDLCSTHAMTAIPLQWICAAVALLAYGEEVFGLHSPRAAATAGVECMGEADSTVAVRVVAHLTGVMRAHITHQLCTSKVSETATITEASAVTDAMTQLRELLISVRRNESSAQTRSTSAPVKLTRRTQTALLLLGVPRAWRALATAVAQRHSTVSTGADGTDAAERCAMELKAVLLSLAPLLASLTHVLQSLECEPGLSEASEESKMPSALPYARVARWVATRLLDEVALVPLTNSSEDSVLVACVRRWTDVAFASGIRTASEGSEAVSTDDPIALADAAAALLHVVEECTTLPLEELHLSEHATHSLMELLQGDDASISGEVSKVGSDDDADGRCPSWLVLWRLEGEQWREMENWLLARGRAMEERKQAENLASEPALAERQAAPVYMDATVPPSSDEDLCRGLLYCEAVLRHLHARDLVSFDATENQSKRRRTENDTDPRAASEAVVQSVERIQDLSRAFLLRAGGSSGAATSDSTAAIDGAPLPPPHPATFLKEVAPPGSEGEIGSDTPVFTLTDTGSVGGRRAPLYAQVIDVE
ncbi:hypothetical protein, conserved [Leishmania tarentolae]|uniref:Uncharacterized protein n=1 Tax=Leishmania tarentolae TaxID=5689 RepID=A0A640KJK0_LEITA|nr:hypothetical protein, conserved [Leishmania tarentolae]